MAVDRRRHRRAARSSGRLGRLAVCGQRSGQRWRADLRQPVAHPAAAGPAGGPGRPQAVRPDPTGRPQPAPPRRPDPHLGPQRRPAADGGPHQPIRPGGTWTPSFEVQQPAATLWYHPHLHTTTAAHVYRGLAGLFLLDDPHTDRLALPKRYGVDDIPLIIQDRTFRSDNTLDTTNLGFGGTAVTGLLGEELLINGTHNPHLDITSQRVRLRLLNASNARVYNLGFGDDRRFWLIGTDAGLLPAPQPLRRVQLSPGERAELLADFTPGERVVLRSFPPTLGANPLYERLAGGDDTFDVLQLRAAAQLRPAPPLPATLVPAAAVQAPGQTRVRTFELGDFTINGQTMDLGRVDQVVPAGSVERWELVNGQAIPHNFHIHDAAFTVLDVDGRPPPPALGGARKDTVFVRPGSRIRLAVQFGTHPDPRTPLMFHCHLLAHEDAGMMGQFIVVRPQDVHRAPTTLAEGCRSGSGRCIQP
jgi:FtsP/CotA-like multicopper oxidase with cupredoxin domain